MKFQVFQFGLSRADIDDACANGPSEKYLSYIQCRNAPQCSTIIKAKSFYKKVAEVTSRSFEDVVAEGGMKGIGNVGDVIISETGVAKFVSFVGLTDLVQYTDRQVEEYVEFV